MSRTLRRSTTLPTWEADRQSVQERKLQKQSRKASINKRDVQDAMHQTDKNDIEIQYYDYGTC